MSEFGGLQKHEKTQQAPKNNSWAGSKHHVVITVLISVCEWMRAIHVSVCVCASSRCFEPWWPWELRPLKFFIIIIMIRQVPRREAGGFWCLPPVCRESQGCQFDPTFLYLLLFFCLVLLLFLSEPFMLLAHSPDVFLLNLHFLFGRLFCVALVLFFWAFRRWVLKLVICALYATIWHWY